MARKLIAQLMLDPIHSRMTMKRKQLDFWGQKKQPEIEVEQAIFPGTTGSGLDRLPLWHKCPLHPAR